MASTPCIGQCTKIDKETREKMLCSLKDIIKLVEQECACDEPPKPTVKCTTCPPEVMVCFEDN